MCIRDSSPSQITPGPTSEKSVPDAARIDDREKEEIRAHYLGIKKPKKKSIKPSEKFKFVFSWDLGDDTSHDVNPLYNRRFDARPCFGRGFIAGMDQKEQLRSMEKSRDPAKKSSRHKRKLDYYLGNDTGKHWSEKTLAEMTSRDWRIFREDKSITTRGGDIPNPIRSWSESNLPPLILSAIEAAGYKEPMPIQMQAIPIGLQGRDIVGVAETGSGKTAAFVIPMLVYISKLPKMTAETEGDGPYAVILAPARELAMQIEKETIKFAEKMGIRTVSLVGGQNIEEQAFALRNGCEIVIATPGRLNDCLDRRYIVLNQCNYVVMDEADRMIDMGFEPQVLSILEAMPAEALKSEDEKAAAKQEGKQHKYRTTIMYSATMPPSVERISRKYLRRAAKIRIGEDGKVTDTIEQNVEWLRSDGEKRRRVIELLNSDMQPPIMIFMNQRKSCDSLSKQLEKLGFKSTVLHAGRSQDNRERAMRGFRKGKYDILVATDVAGRGIDVKGVTHVINYDMPKTIEDYTHRIGRTGRAGTKGVSISFITAEDTDIMYDLKNLLLTFDHPVPAELANHPSSQQKPGTIPQRKSRSDTVIYNQNG
eukprot:TRINITY_DN6668_c0_g1_i1.p1 TRINITY_DN6668_c0_g1~~TRINITY_DN6668_c0_g1_i1.p1  ORF type:complete len:593 (+),score=126.03 TRINITY_DN6668_c0_g1_i1:43-1821(+)